MALQFKHTGFNPNWGGRELSLPAQGMDDYGTIWGGTLGVFDFSKADYPDTSKIGTEFYNLRTGAAPMVGASQNGDGSPNITGILAADGITLSSSVPRLVEYPSTFKLDTLPANSSVVLWWWLKNSSTVTANNLNAVAGYGYGASGANVQWSLVQQGVANKFRFAIGSGGVTVNIDAGDAGGGQTHLYALYIKKTGTSSWTAYAYIDSTLIGSAAGAYPFNNPATSYPGIKPLLGYPGAYGPAYNGIVKRTGGRRVDPATFDIAEWLTEEIANNAVRLA